MGVVFALQYSINKGIPLFGDRAEETISKTKAAAWFCYLPSCACPQLAPEQCKQALASLLCITAKWCSRIKDAIANAVMTDSYKSCSMVPSGYFTVPYHIIIAIFTTTTSTFLLQDQSTCNVNEKPPVSLAVTTVFENGFEGFEWEGKYAIWKFRKLASVDSIPQRWRNGIPAMESVSRERVVSSFDPVVIRPKLFRFLQLSKGWHANFDNHAKYASFCDRAMEGFKREVECWMNGSLGIPLLLLLC